MANPLKLAEPPRRKNTVTADEEGQGAAPAKPAARKPAKAKAKPQGEKFTHVGETEMVQFNRRIKRGVSDGYEMLAIKTRKKVPELLEEALALLEEKYGKV